MEKKNYKLIELCGNIFGIVDGTRWQQDMNEISFNAYYAEDYPAQELACRQALSIIGKVLTEPTSLTSKTDLKKLCRYYENLLNLLSQVQLLKSLFD